MNPGLNKGAYEGLVLERLRGYLVEQDSGLRYDGKIVVEDIRLDTSGRAHMLELLFRDEARPWCLFGWRFPATGADLDALEGSEDPAWEGTYRGPEQAESWAGSIVLTNFEEEIQALGYGLPRNCVTDGVTWIGDYRS